MVVAAVMTMVMVVVVWGGLGGGDTGMGLVLDLVLGPSWCLGRGRRYCVVEVLGNVKFVVAMVAVMATVVLVFPGPLFLPPLRPLPPPPLSTGPEENLEGPSDPPEHNSIHSLSQVFLGDSLFLPSLSPSPGGPCPGSTCGSTRSILWPTGTTPPPISMATTPTPPSRPPE